MKLEIRAGHVEFTIHGRTYASRSMEEFRAKYPELSRQYPIDRFASREKGMGAVHAWSEWRRWFENDTLDVRRSLDWGGDWWKHAPLRSELESWVEEQRRLFQRFVKGTASAVGLGFEIAPIDEPLFTHLGLRPGEGVRVVRVEPRTAAAKAGLRRQDLILAVQGRAVEDPEAFAREFREMLGSRSTVSIQVIRAGKRISLQMHPE